MYHQLINDLKDLISKNITLDKIVSGFPDKNLLSNDCCKKITSEEHEDEKVKRLLEYFLGRDQEEELQTLFKTLVQEDALSSLQPIASERRNKLKKRSLDGSSPAEISNDEQPVSSRSASDVQPTARSRRVEEVEDEFKRMHTKRNKSKICQLM